jgi:hypothetical protein
MMAALRGAGRYGYAGLGNAEGKQFFFEKKNQKTFATGRTRCRNAHAKIPKVFWFFFSKKNTFPSSRPYPSPARYPAASLP